MTRPSTATVLSGTASDAHTWNLIYLQLLLEELGHPVTNLGPCTPDAEIASCCRALRPGLVVISSVNGHGCTEGLRLAPQLRALPELAGTRLVIGGKLDTDGGRGVGRESRLLAAGFDRVFGDADIGAFVSYLDSWAVRRAS